ncbi:TadE/TadG family type IV pilus assembly protein [Novosphingobium album (ex Liu et al. 2023)]|uniref:TadE/TadG family type IV pilus assembly protein n=1 Tax=Novosphingobium album (ex Liu et al. 2023) TaxID=3031130 RepID=A0ABT5WMM5_9SPHN|nr:TadE/TadG family type IV pilus assembly protein [Novosphingobium album (ex Liu et al. 2023)]MDE8651295.1 TadE/TadG family type IV pilus assembly protein [Novosphingobium album (ex Liu et al. 2023)]
MEPIATPRRIPGAYMGSGARRLRRALRRLDARGNATIEFALMLPILLTLGLYGTELAYMASVRMEVGELASAVADNASRLGQTDNSGVTPTISESDITSLMAGAKAQGASFDFADKGRLILTSLERDPVTGKQWIHWQRCTGALTQQSAYGNETTRNGLNGPVITGIGPSKVTASANSPIMYVEVFYDYTPLFGSMYVDEVSFKQEAAYQVRDDRNTSTPPGGTTNRC